MWSLFCQSHIPSLHKFLSYTRQVQPFNSACAIITPHLLDAHNGFGSHGLVMPCVFITCLLNFFLFSSTFCAHGHFSNQGYTDGKCSLSRQPNRQIPDKWEHDMFQAGGAVSSPRGKQGGGSKLMISNLDYGVSDADLRVSDLSVDLNNNYVHCSL